ncbi:MAG: Spy/CpxP family protein refolding chaperone [Burkholderiales bacterium]
MKLKPMKFHKTLIAAALIGATALGTAAIADPGYGGYGMGPGMMGPGMMGPGMMGPGMMGPGMMGPGMMGGYGPGYGMGPGMMGGYGPGYGMGPGMMGGYGTPFQLNLTPEQQNKLNAIHEEFAKKNWELATKMQEEAFKLRNLMSAEKSDRTAVINQYKKLQELRQQRFAARLEAQEKIDGVFTREQKQQLRRYAPWWGQDIE